MAELYEYITDTGTVVPDTADVQKGVEQEFKDAFGQNLIVTANTPQGVLIAAEVTARMAVLRNNAALANQINPALAGGVFLDALWRLTSSTGRIAATRSTVAGVTVTGVVGTIIPAGSIARTAAGDRFTTDADVTIGALGTATVNFSSENFGPVACGIGALTTIVSAILGWETVTNPTGATLGKNRETDAAARRRRRDTLAQQGTALPEAITSGLYDTEGVRSLKFRENTTAAAAVIDGINLAAHSIWVCVDGGTDAAVAATLLSRKSLGAGWNGAVTVNVTEAASGQVYPVKFDRPTAVPVLVRVTARNVSAVADPVTLIQQAILDFAAGKLEDEAGFTVGGSVSPFELAGAVNRQSPGIYVQKVEATLASVVNYQPLEVPIAINQIATLVQASITVIMI